MPTHAINIGYEEVGTNDNVSQAVNITADGKINEGVISVPSESADLQVIQSIDVSQLKSLMLLSTVDMTIETNDGTTPADTLTLAANVPLLWFEGCGFDNPLTTDVTALFLTTGDVGEGTLTMRGLMDLTP